MARAQATVLNQENTFDPAATDAPKTNVNMMVEHGNQAVLGLYYVGGDEVPKDLYAVTYTLKDAHISVRGLPVQGEEPLVFEAELGVPPPAPPPPVAEDTTEPAPTA